MNHIDFKVEKLSSPNRGERWRFVADIYIDGTRLDELLTAYELPLFMKNTTDSEDAHTAAGGYYGSKATNLYNQLIVYHRETHYHKSREKVELCRCPWCDCEGCMSLYAAVQVTKQTVIWKDFENFSRFVDIPGAYDEFGPFVFDKLQYEEAITKLVKTN